MERVAISRDGQRKEERANRGKHLVHDVHQHETDDGGAEARWLNRPSAPIVMTAQACTTQDNDRMT